MVVPAREVHVPVIVVTRLRLRDPAFLDDFFAAGVALLEQATGSDGNLGANTLAEPTNAWWSCTAWRDRETMRAFVDTDPHQAPRRAWMNGATRPPSATGSKTVPSSRTGKRRIAISSTRADQPT
jgi:heme-degrading monooxygenase HmoA